MLKATPYGVVGGIGSPPYGVTATISVSGCLKGQIEALSKKIRPAARQDLIIAHC